MERKFNTELQQLRNKMRKEMKSIKADIETHVDKTIGTMAKESRKIMKEETTEIQNMLTALMCKFDSGVVITKIVDTP
eukprot:12124324-Ditylum_brightwellii.AAC.1